MTQSNCYFATDGGFTKFTNLHVTILNNINIVQGLHDILISVHIKAHKMLLDAIGAV